MYDKTNTGTFHRLNIDSTPTPRQTVIGLRWAAGFAMLSAFVLGLNGGYFVVWCMALTLFSVFLFAVSNAVTKN